MIGRGFWRIKATEEVEAKGFDAFELRLGDLMRGERATMGKSLLDVQRELKIKASYIAAIENCDPSAFDTPGFIAGYVRSYARYLNIDPSRITFIENFLDNAQRLDSQAATPKQVKTDIDVLGVFRLASEKNPFLFLNYCNEIRKFLPNSKFLIVGDGPMRGELEAQIHVLNLINNFSIIERANIGSLMDRAKVVLLTSDFEGTPNIILEAMAKGLPVFATDVGENANLLKDGRGYILEPLHISKDAKLISDVINNEQKRLDIGSKSKEFIAQWRDDLLIAQDFMNQF
jgi:glycosyltransferase involved in cell wall biosynthesis